MLLRVLLRLCEMKVVETNFEWRLSDSHVFNEILEQTHDHFSFVEHYLNKSQKISSSICIVVGV